MLSQQQLEDNKCGIIVEPNPKALAEGLILVLRNDKLRRELAGSAKAVAERIFNWDRQLKCIQRLYKGLAR